VWYQNGIEATGARRSPSNAGWVASAGVTAPDGSGGWRRSASA